MVHNIISYFFFFNDTATTEIYTLSLHDALPICADLQRTLANHGLEIEQQTPRGLKAGDLSPVTKHLPPTSELGALRSEEHTSELQSQSNLVCRLLLEKKKKTLNLKLSCLCSDTP